MRSFHSCTQVTVTTNAACVHTWTSPCGKRAVEMLGAKTTRRSHTCAAVPLSMSCRVLGPPRTTTGALCNRWPARADLRPTSTDTGVQRRLGRGGVPVVTAAFSSPRTNASTSVKGARYSTTCVDEDSVCGGGAKSTQTTMSKRAKKGQARHGKKKT